MDAKKPKVVVDAKKPKVIVWIVQIVSKLSKLKNIQLSSVSSACKNLPTWLEGVNKQRG